MLIPGLGRYPGEGNGNPFQYSCLRNLTDKGPWQATINGVTNELDMTEGIKTTTATWTLNQLFRAFSLHVNMQKRTAIYLGEWGVEFSNEKVKTEAWQETKGSLKVLKKYYIHPFVHLTNLHWSQIGARNHSKRCWGYSSDIIFRELEKIWLSTKYLCSVIL